MPDSQMEVRDDKVWQKRHKVILGIAWVNLLLTMSAILVLSEVKLAEILFFTGAFAFLVFATTSLLPTATKRMAGSISVTFALLNTSFIIVSALDGMTEAHFHFYVVLTVVSMYHRMEPLLFGFATIVAHHLMLGPSNSNHIVFQTDHNLTPFELLALHLSLLSVFVLVLVIRQRTITMLSDQVQTVTTAFEVSADIAEFEQRRANAAEKAQDEFFGAMVHQLKTPLTVVRGWAEVMVDNWEEIPEDYVYDSLGRIVESADRMNDIIEGGLEVIKNEGEGWKSDLENIDDICSRVQGLTEELQVQFPGLRMVQRERVCARIRADTKIIRTIMEHLVENAHTHGFRGRPITVAVTPYRRYVEISVSSWGPNDREKLDEGCFVRGYRGKGSVGTGLGLWIVKNYARSMGGDVRVEQVDREEDRCTTFCLDLPVPVSYEKAEEHEVDTASR